MKRLSDPPESLRAKVFDKNRVDYLVKKFMPNRIAPAVVVVWDLTNGEIHSDYSKAFAFDVPFVVAADLRKKTGDEFKRMIEDNLEREWMDVKCFLITGRHTTAAMRELYACKYSLHFFLCCLIG